MRKRTLGRTGLQVSEIGHGLYGIGSWSDSEPGTSENALRLSHKLGCNFYDTAWVYGMGLSDQLVNNLLSANPKSEIVVATKIPPKNMKWPGSPNDSIHDAFPVDYIIEFAEKIRKGFDNKPLDLLQYHTWDDSWAEEAEFKESVLALKEKGIIKHFGLSLNKWYPENGIRAIETGLVDSVQVAYNIFDQIPEDILFPVCSKHNIGVIARVPLDEGSLGGKMTIKTKFPESDWRAKYFNPENLAQTMQRVDRLKKIVPDGMSLPEMALRFVLSNEVVSTVIIGMRNERNVFSNTSLSDGSKLETSLIDKIRHHRWDRRVSSPKS